MNKVSNSTYLLQKYAGIKEKFRFKNVSPLVLFLTVSTIIFVYRYFLMWRVPINEFYADEIDWVIAKSNRNILEYILLPDAGYPVPVTRVIFWSVTNSIENSALAIHLLSSLVASFCSASIILQKKLSIATTKKIIIAFSLGFYQAFDLLLWHQVNYYLFIPASMYLLIHSSRPEGINLSKGSLSIVLLLIGLGKPQLVLSCLLILIIDISRQILRGTKLRKKQSEVITLIYLFSSIIVGRFSNQALELLIEPKNLLYAITGSLRMSATIVFPFFTVASLGFAKITDMTIVYFVVNLTITLVSVLLYIQMRRKNFVKLDRVNQDLIKVTLFAVIPIYFSIFLFINSGWSQNIFWNNECNSCMVGRHTYGIFMLFLLIIQFFLRSRVLIWIPIQFIALNILSWQYLQRVF
jgi:hypothetical protein